MTKVTDVINRKKTFVSIEITPPSRGIPIDKLFSSMEKILPYNPSFVNVTYHQPEMIRGFDKSGTATKRYVRKKPGTVGVCAAIQSRYNIETIPHLICGGHDIYETEDALIDLNYLGFDNLFVVRGDASDKKGVFYASPDGHKYASDLVKQINNMNKGDYLHEIEYASPTDFCIGVAGYPEKHAESVDIEEDMKNLKKKVDSGAHYIITQMFFDFDAYRSFVERIRKKGIKVPVIPGIKPIYTKGHLAQLPGVFNVSIPDNFVKAVQDADTKREAFENGIRETAKLVEKLIDYGAPGIHLFTMGRGRSCRALLDRVFGGTL